MPILVQLLLLVFIASASSYTQPISGFNWQIQNLQLVDSCPLHLAIARHRYVLTEECPQQKSPQIFQVGKLIKQEQGTLLLKELDLSPTGHQSGLSDTLFIPKGAFIKLKDLKTTLNFNLLPKNALNPKHMKWIDENNLCEIRQLLIHDSIFRQNCNQSMARGQYLAELFHPQFAWTVTTIALSPIPPFIGGPASLLTAHLYQPQAVFAETVSDSICYQYGYSNAAQKINIQSAKNGMYMAGGAFLGLVTLAFLAFLSGGAHIGH